MKRLFWLAAGVAFGVLVAGVAMATRNSSGTYSLPNSPFVSGTSISSSVMNGNFGDISQSLTDSLDRNGKGGMLAPLRVTNGSVTAPTLSFTNDTDTGLYLVGDANPAMTVAGTQRQAWTSTGTAVNGNVSLTTAGAQSILKTGGVLQVATTDASDVWLGANGGTRLTLFGAGGIGANGNTIAAVGTPVNTTDAATKGYVDRTPQISASCGTFSTTSGTYVDITNLSVTITTTGRPVLLAVIPDGGGVATSYFQPGSGSAQLNMFRGATSIGEWGLAQTSFSSLPGLTIDAPAAGTYTYKLQMLSGGGVNSYASRLKLLAVEL